MAISCCGTTRPPISGSRHGSSPATNRTGLTPSPRPLAASGTRPFCIASPFPGAPGQEQRTEETWTYSVDFQVEISDDLFGVEAGAGRE